MAPMITICMVKLIWSKEWKINSKRAWAGYGVHVRKDLYKI